jgi:ATP-binding cassette, subfamily B (MDR/TAP), member 1
MIGIRLSSAIRLHYLQRLFGQSIHVLDSMPPGYATGTITSTANVLQLGISEKLGTFVEYNSTIVAAIIVAFVKNWSLTLVTSSIILYLFLVLGTFLPMILKVNALITKVSVPLPSETSSTDQELGRGQSWCGCERSFSEC